MLCAKPINRDQMLCKHELNKYSGFSFIHTRSLTLKWTHYIARSIHLPFFGMCARDDLNSHRTNHIEMKCELKKVMPPFRCRSFSFFCPFTLFFPFSLFSETAAALMSVESIHAHVCIFPSRFDYFFFCLLMSHTTQFNLNRNFSMIFSFKNWRSFISLRAVCTVQ